LGNVLRKLGRLFQMIRVCESVSGQTSRRGIAVVATELKDVEVRL